MTFVSYPMHTARIRKRGTWPFKEPFLECLVPGCDWASPMPLNDEWRLDRVVAAAAGHPCRGDSPPTSAIHPSVAAPHTPDVDYLRGAAEALAAIRRRLTYDNGVVYPADAQMLKDAAAELGVTITDWTEVDT